MTAEPEFMRRDQVPEGHEWQHAEQGDWYPWDAAYAEPVLISDAGWVRVRPAVPAYKDNPAGPFTTNRLVFMGGRRVYLTWVAEARQLDPDRWQFASPRKCDTWRSLNFLPSAADDDAPVVVRRSEDLR